MAAKMSLCTISYNYEHYAGIDVENCPTLSMSMSKRSLQISIRRSLSLALTWKCQTMWICCSARRMAASSTKATFCAVPSTFRMIVKWVD